MELNRESAVPLYEQIADHLQQLIEQRHYKPGEKLPSEPMLMETYGVSRLTLRRAISLLAEKRLIVIKQGKGMFVKSPGIEMKTMSATDFKGFYEILTEQGLDVRIECLEFDQRVPPPEIRVILEIPLDQEIRYMKRLFYAKDLPVGIQTTYFADGFPMNPELLERMKVEPIRPLIEQEIRSLAELKYTIEVIPSSPEISELLNLDPGQPVVSICKTSCKAKSGRNVPIETTVTQLAADMCKISFSLK